MSVNLATLERSAITRLSMQNALTNANWPQSLLRDWMSEAYQIMQRRMGLVVNTHQADLTAGTSTYSRPTDLLDDLIYRVMIKTSTGSSYKLDRRTLDYMREVYGLFDDTDYVAPQDWTLKNGSILFQPTPDETVTNGIELDYCVDPDVLSRLSHQATITAAFTLDSAAVTFSASIAGLMVAGDEVGVRTSASVLPDTWYRIESVDSTTTVTLTAVYAGTTNETALWTSAQVPLIESRRPGLTHGAAVDYVLYRAKEMESGIAGAQNELGRWELRLAQIADLAGDPPGVIVRKKDAWRHHPALRW